MQNEIDQEYNTKLAEVYSEKDLAVLKKYIKKHFGKEESVYRDSMYSDIRVDISIIPPKLGKPFFTLVTEGLGAHVMKEQRPDKPESSCRCELIITLNKSWHLEEKSEEWYWPLHMLKDAARILAEKDKALYIGKTVEMKKRYDPLNKFCGGILAEQEVDITESNEQCILTDKTPVMFYQFIPLFSSELKYKKDHGGDPLLKMLKENSLNLVYEVDLERRSIV